VEQPGLVAAALGGISALFVLFVAQRRFVSGLTRATRLDAWVWLVFAMSTSLSFRTRETHELSGAGAVDFQVAAQFGVAVISLCYLLLRAYRLGPWFLRGWRTPVYAWLAYVGIAVVSTTYSAYWQLTAVRGLQLVVATGLSMLLFVAPPTLSTLKSRIELQRLALGIILALVWVTMIVAPSMVRHASPGGAPRLGGTLIWATPLGCVAGLVTLSGFVSVLERSPRRWQMGVFGALAALTLLATRSRAPTLALAVACLIVLVHLRRYWLIWLLVLVVAVVGPFTVDATTELVMRGQDRQLFFGLSGRIPLWLFGLEYIAEKPFLGYGFVAGSRIVVSGDFGSWQPSHMHNAVLEVLVSVGLLGFVPFMIAVLGTVRRSFQLVAESRRMPQFRPVSLELLGTVVIVGIFSLTSMGIGAGPRHMFYPFFIALFALGRRPPRAPRVHSPPSISALP